MAKLKIFFFFFLILSAPLRAFCDLPNYVNVLAPLPYTLVSSPEPRGNFNKLIIPLKHAQNLLLIEATIDGVSGNFILDTGAPYLVLNKTYFRDKFSKSDDQATGITGRGGDVGHTRIKKIGMQDLYYEDVEADITNLAQIENSKGVKILGLMGTNFFTEFEMLIDVRKDIMVLYKLNKDGTRVLIENSATADLKLKMELINNIIFIEGKVKEKSLRFCFDSGAEVNVLSVKANRKVTSEFIVKRRSVLIGSSGQRTEVLSGVLKNLDLGAHSFTAMQTYLTSISELQKAYETYFDGIVGYPLLFNGAVSINFKRNEFSMYLYKNE